MTDPILSPAATCKLPAVVGILRQIVTSDAKARSIDEIYGAAVDFESVLINLLNLSQQLRYGVSGLPGITGGLRVDIQFFTGRGPEEIRTAACAQLASIESGLRSMSAGLALINRDLGALFIDQPVL